MAYDNSKNPFYTGPNQQTGSFDSYNPGASGNSWQQKQQSIQEEIEASKRRQLEQQKQALRSIYHSEAVGVDTAQELTRQGEVLNRTEEKLDSMTAMQKESQRHINSLGSVFGGFKNFFRRDSAKGKSETAAPGSRYEQPGQSLQPALATSSAAQPRVQQQQQQPQQSFGAYGAQQQQQQQQVAGSSNYNTEFHQNLNEMSGGISRIKQLALGLGSELDRQNTQIERVQDKVERTNTTIGQQNKDMNRVLYGSKAPK